MAFLLDMEKNMEIQVNTNQRTYAIHLEKGSLHRVKEIVKPKGRVFIISDDGVPEKWKNILLEQFPEASVHIFKNGEASKICKHMKKYYDKCSKVSFHEKIQL